MQGTALKKLFEKLDNNQNALMMCVGDSITWGCNHCTPNETFCAYLTELLASAYPAVTTLRYDGVMTAGGEPLARYDGPVVVNAGSAPTLTVVKSGVGGDTVARALDRLDDFIGTFQTGEAPDLFLLMFGINDALDDPQKHVTPETFYDNYKTLYERIRAEHPQAVIVMMTPTYNDSGRSTKSCLDPYADKVKQLATETGCQLIDLHDLFMRHLVVGEIHYGQGEWLSDQAGDCCHLSPIGSRAVADFIFKNLSIT